MVSFDDIASYITEIIESYKAESKKKQLTQEDTIDFLLALFGINVNLIKKEKSIPVPENNIIHNFFKKHDAVTQVIKGSLVASISETTTNMGFLDDARAVLVAMQDKKNIKLGIARQKLQQLNNLNRAYKTAKIVELYNQSQSQKDKKEAFQTAVWKDSELKKGYDFKEDIPYPPEEICELQQLGIKPSELNQIVLTYEKALFIVNKIPQDSGDSGKICKDLIVARFEPYYNVLEQYRKSSTEITREINRINESIQKTQEMCGIGIDIGLIHIIDLLIYLAEKSYVCSNCYYFQNGKCTKLTPNKEVKNPNTDYCDTVFKEKKDNEYWEANRKFYDDCAFQLKALFKTPTESLSFGTAYERRLTK